jgi:hypothetical protein
VTSTLRTFKAWARGALKGQLGRDWWGITSASVLDNWTAAASEFGAWSSTYQNAWRAASPYTMTLGDKGLTFYAVCKGIYNKFAVLGQGYFGMAQPVSTNSGTLATWAAKDLTGVFMPGSYDDDHVNFVYSGPSHWDHHIPEEVEALIFFGMTYSWTITTAAATVDFWFFGSRVEIYYWTGFGFGTMKIEIDQLPAVTLSQTTTPYETLITWTSGAIESGLHFVRISQVGTVHPIYFDGLIVAG